jgi:hypothetical protein
MERVLNIGYLRLTAIGRLITFLPALLNYPVVD